MPRCEAFCFPFKPWERMRRFWTGWTTVTVRFVVRCGWRWVAQAHRIGRKSCPSGEPRWRGLGQWAWSGFIPAGLLPPWPASRRPWFTRSGALCPTPSARSFTTCLPSHMMSLGRPGKPPPGQRPIPGKFSAWPSVGLRPCAKVPVAPTPKVYVHLLLRIFFSRLPGEGPESLGNLWLEPRPPSVLVPWLPQAHPGRR